MLIAIINTITSALGVIGFFCAIPILIVIGGVVYVLETIASLMTGELHSIATTVLSSVISILISICTGYNVFLGWCFGLCVESIIISATSLIYIIVFIKCKKSTTNGNTNIL